MKFIKKILNLCRCKLWFKGMLSGITATIELEKLVKDIRAPETIIDIGSNKGQFILLMEKLFPNKTVYSFEPIKSNYDDMIKNINLNPRLVKKIIPINAAIGEDKILKF